MTRENLDILYHEAIRRKIYDSVAGRLGSSFFYSGEKILNLGTDKSGNQIVVLTPRAKMRPLVAV